MDKLICKKKYRRIEEGEIVDFIPRSKLLLKEEVNGDFPIGAIYNSNSLNIKIWNNNYNFIYYDTFKEHFCTLKEYRKLKLEKILLY